MWEKLQDVLDKQGATEEQKNLFYTIMLEHVGRFMDEFLGTVLTDEDLAKIDEMDSEQEVKEYVDRRVKEITGRYPQEHSDEVMESMIAFAIQHGYQRILEQGS